MDFPEGTLTIGGDLKVRRLGFGAMRLTGRGIWGPPKSEDDAIRVLRRAIELGVNLIDTADSYGPEVSEHLIAKALHPYPPGLVIATKGGLLRPGPDRWTPNCRPAHLKEACEGSLRRLKLERIDLYQLHTNDPRVPLEDSIGTLVELRAAGKLRHIGVSNFSVPELKRAQAIAPIVSVQNMYNMSDRKSDPVVDHCEAEGLGFLPWFPLAVGNLARGTSRIEAVAKRHHATPSQIALAWLLKRSPSMLPIPGTSSVAHLEENMAAAKVQLSDEEFRTLAGG
jgi:aryl-alcohol dehydrogenase-like predicted oxidoreductase